MTSNRKPRRLQSNRSGPKSPDEQMVQTYRHAARWGRKFNESVKDPIEGKWTKEQRRIKENEWRHAMDSELKQARTFLAAVNIERKKRGKKPLTFNELEELIRERE